MFTGMENLEKMNKQKKDILLILNKSPYTNQRILAELCGASLGAVNKSLKSLTEEGFLEFDKKLTVKARNLLAQSKPNNAVILAAGYGMRMVPINTETPKGLLEVYGEPLIERLIKQLHEVGVYDISVVVGFMKECYEYLIDLYGVELVVNNEYASKNNLHSLEMVLGKLNNTYVIPCDIWCEQNPFHKNELYSWYMVSDQMDQQSDIRVNRKMELVSVSEEQEGNTMLGISYLLSADSAGLAQRISEMSRNRRYDQAFWEEALYCDEKLLLLANVVSHEKFIEINTYEQLRELDHASNHLNSKALLLAAKVLDVQAKDITNITVLKKGMTNRSFLFDCKEKRYIMRIPGEGTASLINREEETAVYDILKGKDICDHIVYINAENGYKITEYIENARVCNPLSDSDIQQCMEKLRAFHQLNLKVDHEFDIFKQIKFYESLWEGRKSVYRDYSETKKKIFSLKTYIDSQKKEKVLTHIDAVPDNFLFYKDDKENEQIVLIDWEYAGMQDPHVDIAMFCIYAMYEREQVDRLIDAYFIEGCDIEIRIKIYCYIAVCGLLWSNWCEYKRNLGIEFGEYSLRQYRYAKDYYKLVIKELENLRR